MTDIEQDFRDYRDHGDSRALARVFDGMAPELLLVALHVNADRSQAEDAVQETFLQAMLSAESWDDSQPLRPWLAGVLRHVVQKQRRALAQQRAHAGAEELDRPAEDTSPGDDDPVRSTTSRETLEWVSSALRSLPTHYRDVLTLRLVHGLTPNEIAHSLGKSPSTVHTQLQRGLAKLREIAPGSIRGAVLATLVLGSSRGLSAVRRAVLTQSSKHTATAVATSTFASVGVSLMVKKIVLVVLALGVLPLLVWTPWVAPRVPEEGLVGPSTEQEVGHAALPASVPDANDSRERLDPGTGRNDRTVLRSKTEARPILAARCVAAEDSTPLAGVRVVHDDGRGTRVEQTTDAGGRFSFPQRVGDSVSLDVLAPGRVRRVLQFEKDQLLGGAPLEDIRLERGARFFGTVIDESGEPLDGVRLRADLDRAHAGENLLEGSYEYAWIVSAGGQFEKRQPLLPGLWKLRSRDPAFRVVRPPVVDIPVGHDSHEVEIVLHRFLPDEQIKGKVIDTSGRPVGGVTVAVASGARQSTRSAKDGSFVLTRNGVEESARIYVEGSNPTFRVESGLGRYSWGTPDVRIVIRPPVEVTLTVVRADAEAGNEDVVEDYEVYCDALARLPGSTEYSGRTGRPVARGHHPRGRAVLRRIYPGENRMMIVPGDQRLVPRIVDHDTAGAASAIRVELQARTPIQVVVQDRSGAAVVGSVVELMQGDGLTAWHEGITPFSVSGRFKLSHREPLLLDQGTTGAGGSVVLRAPGKGEHLAVRVRGRSHTTKLDSGHAMPVADGRWVVRVTRGGTIRGTVGPLDTLANLSRTGAGERWPSLLLQGPHNQRAKGVEPIEIGRDGSFAVEGVPPGDYRVALYTWVALSKSASVPRVGRIGEVRALLDGELRQVDFDASSLHRGRLRGTIFVDGKPFHGGVFSLMRCAADGSTGMFGHRFGLAVDADGRFDVEVAPGVWRLLLAKQSTQTEKAPISRQTFQVLARQTTDCKCEITRRRIRLRILEADGTPARDRFLVLSRRVEHVASDLRTDADGWLVIDPAPPWPLMLKTPPRGEDGTAWTRRRQADPTIPDLVPLGEFSVADGETEIERTVRIPR